MKKFIRRGIPYKRKLQGKTDYLKRLSLIKSGRLRLVIRRSLKNIIIQFIEFNPDGDKIISSSSSKELAKTYNIKGSLKNTPSAYLIGLLAGKKAIKLKIKEVVPDLGIRKPHTGGAIFAALKGVIDAGVIVPHEKVSKEESVFPNEGRINGEHIKIKQDYAGIKAKILK